VKERTLELSGYLAVVRRWWWTVLVSAWIAALTGYLVASTIPPTYESQVKVLVGPLNTDTDTLRASGQLVQTYAQVVTTREVLASTIQELQYDLTPDEFAAATRASANDVTRILTIRVQAGDRDQATELANTLATELQQLTSRGISRPEGLVQIIEFAQPSTNPVAPQVSLLVLLAALAGVVVAVIVVLLLEYLGNSVRTREEFASLTLAPLLGAVPAPHGNPPDSLDLVVEAQPDSRAAAPYRLVAAKIALGPEGNAVRSVLITDTDWEGEGAIVAANIAAALVHLGRRVALVDGAGADGTITAVHGWRDAAGLAELLAGQVRIGKASADGLSILPGGGTPLEGVDPDRLQEMIRTLTADDGVAVLAGPPIKTAPGTLALARAVDGVILVGRRDRARRDDVTFAAESLRLVGATLMGVILTERSVSRFRRGGQRRQPAAAAVPLEPFSSRVETVTKPRSRPSAQDRRAGARASTGAAADAVAPGRSPIP
jgi:capsular polysaccharide biosynthesis protein